MQIQESLMCQEPEALHVDSSSNSLSWKFIPTIALNGATAQIHNATVLPSTGLSSSPNYPTTSNSLLSSPLESSRPDKSFGTGIAVQLTSAAATTLISESELLPSNHGASFVQNYYASTRSAGLNRQANAGKAQLQRNKGSRSSKMQDGDNGRKSCNKRKEMNGRCLNDQQNDTKPNLLSASAIALRSCKNKIMSEPNALIAASRGENQTIQPLELEKLPGTETLPAKNHSVLLKVKNFLLQEFFTYLAFNCV